MARIWSHADHTFPLPDGHTYPLGKNARLRAAILAEGLVAEGDVLDPEPVSCAALQRAHDPAFVARMLAGDLDRREARVLGLPWSAELIERSRRGTQGTLEAARDALGGQRVGIMLGGGTHHAARAAARGYCLFNDLAVLAGELRRGGAAQRLLVVDCDVHQGDGTAELLAGDRDAFTLSVQCERNYPAHRVGSDLDVELPAATEDDDYLTALDTGLRAALDRFGAPDIVAYLAGADPWEGDRLGRLALTKDGLARRDALVLDRALGACPAVVVTLAGGYAPDVDDTVAINLATVRLALARAADG